MTRPRKRQLTKTVEILPDCVVLVAHLREILLGLVSIYDTCTSEPAGHCVHRLALFAPWQQLMGGSLCGFHCNYAALAHGWLVLVEVWGCFKGNHRETNRPPAFGKQTHMVVFATVRDLLVDGPGLKTNTNHRCTS